MGQVRWLWGSDNAVGLVTRERDEPEPSKACARWLVGTSPFHDAEDVERLPLICPAVEDIGAGDVFAPMYGGHGVVIACGEGAGEFTTNGGGRFSPIPACLKDGWRYVGNLYAVQTTPAGSIDAAIAHLLVVQANLGGEAKAPSAKTKQPPSGGAAAKVGAFSRHGWVFGEDRVSWAEALAVAPNASSDGRFGAALHATVQRLYATAVHAVSFADQLHEYDIAREVKGLPEITSLADLSTWQAWVDKPRSPRLGLGTGGFLVQVLERMSYDVSAVARLMASENQAETVAKLRRELARLREGIRAHRDTRAFERRGWFDDYALHALIDDIPRPTSAKAGE